MGPVESAKAVSEIISPVSETVVETHGQPADEPENLNQDPVGLAGEGETTRALKPDTRR